MNDLDVGKCHSISIPEATDLHAAHVPPWVCLLQAVQGHREHQLDRVIKNADFVLGLTGFISSGQTGAELSGAALAPVLYIAGVLRLVVTRDFEGAPFQNSNIFHRRHPAEEGWRRVGVSE